jgi:hypothetical protein
MADGPHIPIWNRTKKLFAIALSGAGRGLRGRDDGGNVNNVQYKTNWGAPVAQLVSVWYLYDNISLIRIVTMKFSPHIMNIS